MKNTTQQPLKGNGLVQLIREGNFIWQNGLRLLRTWKKCQTLMNLLIRCIRPLVKNVYRLINLLISQPKHMLWVLKRTV